jgi:hypothetical protein
MLSNKLKLACALAMVFGLLSVASAGYDTRCCCKQDPYSKFSNCNDRCEMSEYPQQMFPMPSP